MASTIQKKQQQQQLNATTALPQSGRRDMEEERAKASFPVRQMTFFLDGGEEATKRREKLMMEFERDPTFRVDDLPDLTRPQLRERYASRLKSIAHWVKTDSPEEFQNRLNNLVVADPGFLTRIGVHYGLFLNTIVNQGSEEQVRYWMEKGMMDFKGVIGCFAMTELGHGSNVPGVETIAEFDKERDEFVIHTPTLTATKWWIGGAAESATHSVVYANMVIDGKSFGVKPFVVQLRNPKDFKTLPGVTIGDNGAKMGRNGTDNGWIQYTHVRIPRTNLLMRYTKVEILFDTKVTRDGQVSEPPFVQLSYGALLYVRCMIIKENALFSEKALTIAIRYKQFQLKEDQPETKLLDYQTHKYRLLVPLAGAYAMHFTFMETHELYFRIMSMLQESQKDPSKMGMIKDMLKEAHGTLAGLKAHTGWKTMLTIEACRQACGGHGYSSYAGLSSLYQDFVVQNTWEGDNTVLTLQTGRYLISCVKKALNGKKDFPLGVNYLNKLPEVLHKSCKGDPTSIESMSEAFDVVCANSTVAAGKLFKEANGGGMTEDQAYEKCAIARFKAARIHCVGFIFKSFAKAVDCAPKELQPVLSLLLQLYGLSSINDHSGLFLQYGYLRGKHLEQINKKIMELMDEVRPQAIALTDSFNFSDYMINSPLGCYDGDVYRRYFDQVTRLNPPGQPHPYFETVISPVLNRQ